MPDPTDEITFESFSVLAALAMVTERVRLGHMVVCTGFRNPALTAKLSSTIDVICGGRFELGIGAGWKEDEWIAYGYGFPTLGERMAALGDHLEVVKRMFEPGRASYEGEYAEVRGAINEPTADMNRVQKVSQLESKCFCYPDYSRWLNLTSISLSWDHVRQVNPLSLRNSRLMLC